MRKTTANNEFEQKKLLATVLYDIKTQRDNLDRSIETFRNAAYDAAYSGHDDFADELLGDVADLRQFAENLKFVELKIGTATVQADLFRSLQKLPSALENCRLAFAKNAKVGKLGENLKSLMASLDGAKSEFAQIRKAISSESDETTRRIFGDLGAATSPASKRFFEEEKKRLETEMALRTTPPTPMSQATAAANAEAAANANVDSILGMLDEEKRK